MTERLVIADAGPLIHLDELGQLDLLADFSSVQPGRVGEIPSDALCTGTKRPRNFAHHDPQPGVMVGKMPVSIIPKPNIAAAFRPPYEASPVARQKQDLLAKPLPSRYTEIIP